MKAQAKPQQKQQLTIIAAIVAIAVVGAGIFIFISLGNAGSGGSVDYSTIPQSRTPDGAFVLGNPDAPITIVEFADFLCPFCQGYKSTVDEIIEEFVVSGLARFEYRMLPTHDLSPYVSQVAECAAEMYSGGFWPVHDELFRIASSRRVDDSIGREIAERFGLDYTALISCTRSADQVTIDGRYASSLGISSTPSIRIRYGNSEPQVISPTYARSGVPFDVIQATVLAAQLQSG